MNPTEPPPPAPSPAPPNPADPPAKRRNALGAYVGLPEVGWGAMTVMVGVLVAVAALTIGTIIVALFDPDLDSNAGRNAVQLVVGLSLGLTAIGFAAAEVGGRLRETFARFGLGHLTLRIAVMAGLGWLAYLAVAALLAPILQPDQQDVTRELGTDEGSVLSVIVAGFLIVIVAPLSEELFFRGFMYAGLRRALSIWPAAAISAMVWGSLHLTAGNVGVAIQISVLGVVLAYLYERSGSLWTPIIAHALNNGIAFTLLLTGVF